MEDMDPRLRKLIKLLMDTGDYVSGPVIAEELGVSRSMVHHLIDDLRKRGFIIESHSRRGYRLLVTDDLRLANSYVEGVGNRLKFNVYYVGSCSSTQDIADLLAGQGAGEGTVVLAEEMTMGRGRLGRKWIASRGGLWFTIILRPRIIAGLHLISLALGLSVTRALESLFGVRTGLKWPNDVLYGDRKLSGILVEVKAEADTIKYVLAGIGLNVNNDLPMELRNTAVSLKEVMGGPLPRIPILRSILYWIDRYYDILVRGMHGRLLGDWRKYSLTIGRRVRAYTVDGKLVEGVAEDVAEDGSLVIRIDDGRKTRVYAGDIVHLR